MNNRNSFTVTNDDIFISVIVVVDGQVLKIRGDVMRDARVHNPIRLGRSWSSHEIRLRPL